MCKKVISEEHVSLIEESNLMFLGNITPKSDAEKDVADSMQEFLEDTVPKKKNF